ncbi:MAG: hypothetical protein V4584_11690 [Verrucomicrobiota bacterium]
MLRFFLFLALALQVSAQETMIREVFDPVTDTHVEVLALFTKPSPGGYFPVRVKIANNLKRDSDVRLDFESSPTYNEELRAGSTFDFAVPAGKAVTRDIMVPLSPTRDYDSGIMITAKLSGSLGRASNSIRADKEKSQPAVLLSEALFTPNASTLDSEMNTALGGSSSGSSRGSVEFAAKFDPKQLPDDWLAFSGYDSVILTDADWSNIPPGARNALLSWVRLGGQLMVYSSDGASSSSLGLPSEAGFGSISRPAMVTGSTFAADMVKAVIANTNKPQHASQHNDYQAAWPLRKVFGGQTSHYTFFVIIMICFGILVGPVNLFVFAKSGQRHRLFITTPIISLAASLLLIGLIILLDGFGGNGVRRVLMEVRPDGDVNAAYVHQEQFARTGVLTGAEFTLDTPSFFQPVSIEETRLARFTSGSGQKGAFNLQPADGKLIASGDWFQSRSEHGQILSSVVPTRGRIETTDTPGTLLSTFDYPIDSLYFLDASQQWHRAEGITAGKRFTLSPVDPSMVLPALTAEANAFSYRNNQLLETAKNRPGHFVAITTHAPGIDTHRGIRWKETRTVITGPVVAP